MHLAVPFPSQRGPGPQLAVMPGDSNSLLSSCLRRLRSIEQAPALRMEVAPTVGLHPVGQDPK